jgi:signal transduction histidine kinase
VEKGLQGYDLRTLVSVCAAIFAGLTLALVVVWRQSRGTAGLSTLSLAHGVTAVAAVLVAVSGGRGPVTAIVANTLLVAAPALLHQGTRRFFDLPARPVRTAGVTLGALAGFTWATLVEPSTFARTLLFSGAGSALFAAATWVTAFHGRRREPSPTVALMAACLGILAGFMGLRFVFALFGTGFAGLWAAAVLVVTPMAGVGWIVGLVTTLNQRLLVSLRQSRDLFESLLSVSQAVSGGPGVRDTLRGALEVANRLTGAQGASLHLIDEKGQVARGLHTRGAVDSPPHTPRSLRLIREGLAGWVARERATALVRDTDDDPRWVPLSASDQPARSALAVPISSDEVLVGVLTLVHSEPHHFDDGHRLLMEAAAAQMALALRNAQIADARLTLAQRQTLLYEVLRAASQRHDTALIAAAAARAITEGTRYTRVDVVLPGTDGHWDIYSSDAPPGEAPFRPTLVEGIVGRAFATRATQVVPDVTRDPDYRERSPGVRSEMCVPLAAGERLLGVLNVESNVPTTFSDEDVRAVESLGEAIVLGLENARLYAQVSAQRARLEAVIESSRDGLVLVGTDGRLLLVSEPALRQLGLQGSSQDWFGWPGEALDAMLRAHGTGAALPAGYVEGNAGGPESGEWRIDTRTLVWLNLPVPDVGRLLVVRDVTQEREAERLRDTLTHTLVHDLRNPLAAIFGALELLREAVTSSPQHVELLRLAQDNAERQLRLISAILDVSRLEQGALPLERGALALRGVVANALRLVAPAARAQSLELADNVPEGLPDAWADGDLVARVLDNLLNNAIRFTPHGGRVTVGADVVPGGAPGGRVLRVRVSDTGRGVAEDVRPRLFQKFSTGRGRGSGSGLGLAFCRLVVEAHGGTIWLEDGAGPGTTIVFTLPAAGAARHALAGPEPVRA